MENHNHDKTLAHLTATVSLFGDLLKVEKKAVPPLLLNQALLRRLRISFLALYEHLRETSHMPDDMNEKPLDEIADYFIAQKGLSEEDKKTFLILGSIYTAIRWSEPGTGPYAEKIMAEVPAIYEFLRKITAP